ncbi:MAG: PAS domain S-box protein [Kiritimatiellae bacterium]|nr:PAS domain S-box protein [Kiritimatiellia bacterium]
MAADNHEITLLFQRLCNAGADAASLEEVARRVHEALASVLPAANVHLAIRCPVSGMIRVVYWCDSRSPVPAVTASGRSPVEQVLRTGRPWVGDARALTEAAAAGHFELPAVRPAVWCGIPLRRQSECYGVLVVQSYEGEPALEPVHCARLCAVNDAISVAILPHLLAEERDSRDALLEAAAACAAVFLRDVDWRPHMNEFLERMGRAAKASRTYLFDVWRDERGRLLTSQLFEWVAEGIEPQIHNAELQKLDMGAAGFQRWVERLEAGEPISGPVALLPPSERPLLQRQGIRSIHVTPVHVEGKWWGFLGFDDCLSERIWLPAEQMALRVGAEILAQAIHRQRVEEQSALQRTALATAASGVMITDARGRILWVNAAMCRMSGYSADELIDRTPAILKSGEHDAEFYHRMWETICAGRVWAGEIRNRRKDGGICVEEMTITPVTDAGGRVTHFVAIKQDVTERMQLREQLIQAHKLESIGRLAGGIAHDFNNLLQAILGFSALLRADLSESDPRRADVMEIEKAARRAAELTRQLLLFSRRQKPEMVALDLNEVIRGAARLLGRLLPEHVRLVLDLPGDLPSVRGNAAQLEQILVNLAVNARDAMPRGGALHIRTALVQLRSEEVPAVEGARPGRFVLLEVEDEGHGMPPAVLARIFEPFFTTKPASDGTGLGLSVVYGLVRQHEGFIDVASEVGRGTVFRIYLPVSSAGNGRPAADEVAEGGQSAGEGAGHEVLVVEDEECLRALATRVLTAGNYRVTAVGSLAAARRVLEQGCERFAVLLSDVLLPDGHGLDLAAAVRRCCPDMRIVLTSGHEIVPEEDPVRWALADAILRKPYLPDTLLRTLGDVLPRAPT